MTSVGVVSGGSMGTAIASLLCEKSISIKIWIRDKHLSIRCDQEKRNLKYFPRIQFPKTVQFSHSLRDVVEDSEVIFIALPSSVVRPIAKKMSPYIGKGTLVVSLSKGMEYGTWKTMSEVLEEELHTDVSISALSGPNLAHEIAQRFPTVAMIANCNPRVTNRLRNLMTTPCFKVIEYPDARSLEIAGVLKNIVAVSCGIADGLGYGLNTKAAVISIGTREIMRIGERLGAEHNVFETFAGLGDVIVTSLGGRNRMFGERLARHPFDSDGFKNVTIEGRRTVRLVHKLASDLGIRVPLVNMVYSVIFLKEDPRKAFMRLWDDLDS